MAETSKDRSARGGDGKKHAGFESVDDALAEVMVREREAPTPGESIYFIVDRGFDEVNLHIIEITSDVNTLAEVGIQTFVPLSQTLSPIAVICSECIFEERRVVGVRLCVEDATRHVTEYVWKSADAEGIFEKVGRRHLSEGEDFPLIPESWEAMVDLGLWDEDMTGTKPTRNRFGNVH